ncbi:type II secretion system protein [Thermomonas sp.]|uniref:type II secretion system protein n=1 Tax=Thermomonas sp. TaxID=1971895 RepID=UPI003918EAE3
MSRRDAEAGFTLLEAIVTLVIVSMLVTVLMNALSQSLSLRTRMLRVQGESRQMLLQEAWFRDSVAAAQPPTRHGEVDGFVGDAGGIQFVSAAPLAAIGSVRVRWWLQRGSDGEVALHYEDPTSGDLLILPGPLQGAGFSYLGVDGGDWMSEWRSTTADEASRLAEKGSGTLPKLVRFQATTASGRQLYWLVYLPADLRAVDRIDFDEAGHVEL